MEENKIVMLCQVVSRIVNENQLPEAAEAEIRKILEKNEKKEICLASVVEKELENAIKLGQISESYVKLYQSVFEESIRKSEIGNMPAAELSEIIIRKFVLQAGKVYEMDRSRLKCFTGMLQTGLNKMEKEGMLHFVPTKHVYKDYLRSEGVIQYIDNPYTSEEVEKIKEWVDLHFNDIRGLAVGLWFCGGISLEEIASLKKKDWHISIYRKWEKAQIISRALSLHPKNERYVFMALKGGRLEKLTAQSFQMKLYHICNELGIEYKKINRNEAVVCKE